MGLAEDTGSDLPWQVQVQLYRAEGAADEEDWAFVVASANEALELDPANADALAFIEMAAWAATHPALSDDARQAFINEGAVGRERVWIAHYFAHFQSSWSERAQFKAELRRAGFGSGGPDAQLASDEEITGDTYWHHYAFTVLAPSDEVTSRADGLARDIAARHDVRYDGWRRSPR